MRLTGMVRCGFVALAVLSVFAAAPVRAQGEDQTDESLYVWRNGKVAKISASQLSRKKA